ncbi:hypothetical protein QYM36_016362 [Artemia franciscana]|uniref:Uncharacterized protein n=1 Tax=Artemia franciscana TaxID=6661 RepID=A0AA88H7J2_ARTSF|nr:hypothetical protein QYM36_016362 [Artemia franciscana]
MKFKYFWFSFCLVGCLYASETGSTDESSTYDVTESTLHLSSATALNVTASLESTVSVPSSTMFSTELESSIATEISSTDTPSTKDVTESTLDMNSTTGISSTSPLESTVSVPSSTLTSTEIKSSIISESSSTETPSAVTESTLDMISTTGISITTPLESTVSVSSSTLSSTTLKSSTASEISSTDTPSTITESTLDMSMSTATGISSTSPLESTASLPSSTLSSTTLKSSTASEISSTDKPSAITESTVDMSMSSATGISSTSPVESTVSLPSSTLSSTTLKSSTASEISITDTPSTITESTLDMSMSSATGISSTSPVESTVSLPSSTLSSTTLKSSITSEISTNYSSDTTSPTNVTETSTPVEVTTTEVLNTTKSTNSATTTSKVISTTEVEVSTECFLATPPYPPACPEGFSGSAYWECECNSPECKLVLLNCNNIWLDSVNCEVGLQALVDFATNLQDGLFLQHEVEKILDKLLICFNMTLNEDEDDGMLTESALSSVEYILTKSNQSISEEERLRNLVTSTTAIKSMGDQLLETSGMQGQPIFSQSSSGKVNLGVTRSNSEVNFGFNSVNVTIPNGKKIKDIIAFEIEEEGVAPGTLSSFGESGKTNSPILGVSLTDTETRIQILADSQLNENEEIQMIFKNFLPVDGPFESIRRDLFPGESQTIRQGSMECSFLAESPSLFPYWSSYGCEVVESTTEYTQCKCNHPGTFAAIGENQNYLGKPLELDIVWYCFTIFSIVCCLAVLLILIFKRDGSQSKVKEIRRFGLINLVLCLIVSDFMILLFMDKSKFYIDEAACTAVGAILHYFILGAFTWITVEAATLLREITSPTEFNLSRSVVYIIFGYTIPALFVAAALLEAHFIESDVTSAYVDAAVCWLTAPDYVWNFYAPALALVCLNIIFTVYGVDRAYKVNGKKDDSRCSYVGLWWKSSLAFSMVLTVTWTFGFFFTDKNIELSYCFIVVNGLKGLVLLLSAFFIFIKRNSNELPELDYTQQPIQAYDKLTEDQISPPALLRSRFGGPERQKAGVFQPEVQLYSEQIDLSSTKNLIPRVSLRPRQSNAYSTEGMQNRPLSDGGHATKGKENFGKGSYTYL